MIKMVTIFILSILGIIFVIQNSDHINIQLLVGHPIQIRLIFVLLTFFLMGFFVAYIRGLKKENDMQRKLKLLQSERQQLMQEVYQESEAGN